MGIFDAIASENNAWKNMLYNTGMTLYSSAQSKKEADKAFERQKELLNLQQQWAERMSNTQYQRTRQDLEEAGFNPLLAVTNGANSNTSASATGVTPADTSMFSDLAKNQPFMTKLDLADLNIKRETAELLKNQQTESVSRTMLNNAQKLDAEASAILKNKESNWADKRWATTIQQMNSQIKMNYMNSALMNSEIELNRVKKETERSQAWRNRNMALGFSETRTDSYSNDDALGVKVTGVDSKHGKSRSTTYSHSW